MLYVAATKEQSDQCSLTQLVNIISTSKRQEHWTFRYTDREEPRHATIRSVPCTTDTRLFRVPLEYFVLQKHANRKIIKMLLVLPFSGNISTVTGISEGTSFTQNNTITITHCGVT